MFHCHGLANNAKSHSDHCVLDWERIMDTNRGTNIYLYVLKLQNSKLYVGQSIDPEKRILKVRGPHGLSCFLPQKLSNNGTARLQTGNKQKSKKTELHSP